MQKFLFRTLANILQIKEPKLNILIYHRVMPEPDPLRPWEIDKQRFRHHMEWISDVFNVIPLPEAVEQLKSGTLKRRSLCITFDDGYLDNATEALPILKEFGFHATFFCTSAWLDGGLMWNDQVIESIRVWPEETISISEIGIGPLPVKTVADKNAAIEAILPRLKYEPHDKRRQIASSLAARVAGILPELMMHREHIRELHRQGMEIGGHTHSHPIIAKLSEQELTEELVKNRDILEQIIQTPLTQFAFPNGKPGSDFRPDQIKEISNSAYVAAFTTVSGAASTFSNLFTVPRFTPWDRSVFRFIARLLLADTR